MGLFRWFEVSINCEEVGLNPHRIVIKKIIKTGPGGSSKAGMGPCGVQVEVQRRSWDLVKFERRAYSGAQRRGWALVKFERRAYLVPQRQGHGGHCGS